MARRTGQDKAEEGAGARSYRASNARLGSLVYPEGDGSHGRVKEGRNIIRAVLDTLFVLAAVPRGRRGGRGPVGRLASNPGSGDGWGDNK